MSAEASDEELMARVAAREEDAFRLLVERHQDRIYGTVARMMGGAGPETEEVAQDIFLRVWRAAGTYRPEGKFVTWLMTVTRNLVFTRVGQRRKKKEVEGEDCVDPETGESFISQQPDATGRGPSDLLACKELESAVQTALSQLPENQRLVVHLRQVEGLEFEEIGKITGLSLSAVKALIFRARESLKKKLSGYLTASD